MYIMGEYKLLSYYLPLTYIKMDLSIAMYNYASRVNPVHYRALPWPTVTYRALSSALLCTTVHSWVIAMQCRDITVHVPVW